MFAQFLGLKSNPFEINAETENALFHKSFQYIYDCLVGEINSNCGIVLLIGPSGIGKTTLTRQIVEDFNQQGKSIQRLDAKSIVRELIDKDEPILEILSKHKTKPETPILFQDMLGEEITGKKRVIIIDHTEWLNDKDLRKLISHYIQLLDLKDSPLLILAGAIELYERFSSSVPLAPLKDFIINCYFFKNLYQEEVSSFIDSRLAITGKTSTDYFSTDVITRIYDLTHGIPGGINNLCAATLIMANTSNQQKISCDTVNEAAEFCALPQKHPDKQIPGIAQNFNKNVPDRRSKSRPATQDIVLKHPAKTSNTDHPANIQSKSVVLTKPFFYAKHATLFVFLGCILGMALSVLFFNFQTPIKKYLFTSPWQLLSDFSNLKETPESLTIKTDPIKQTQSPANIIDSGSDNTNLAAETFKHEPIASGISAVDGDIMMTHSPSSKQEQKLQPIETATQKIFTPQIDNEEITSLIALATKQTENFQYTMPIGNNALATFQKILQLDAENIIAIQGIKSIKERYLLRASNAELKGETVTALLNYQKAYLIATDDKALNLKIVTLEKKLP